MGYPLLQNTSVTIVLGPFVSDTDFKTPQTALTINATDQDGDIVGFTDNATIFNIINTTCNQAIPCGDAEGDISFNPPTVGNHSVNITVWDSTGGRDWQVVWFQLAAAKQRLHRRHLESVGNQR